MVLDSLSSLLRWYRSLILLNICEYIMRYFLHCPPPLPFWSTWPPLHPWGQDGCHPHWLAGGGRQDPLMLITLLARGWGQSGREGARTGKWAHERKESDPRTRGRLWAPHSRAPQPSSGGGTVGRLTNTCVEGWLSIDCSKGASLLSTKPWIFSILTEDGKMFSVLCEHGELFSVISVLSRLIVFYLTCV